MLHDVHGIGAILLLLPQVVQFFLCVRRWIDLFEIDEREHTGQDQQDYQYDGILEEREQSFIYV